ncbi:GNAT family N-acetyltransferase [Nocardia sp. XZ_19_385]|uniref:GNAT family N-acetyltransferase n=1 Tax=Nocardia sp. XZ_19_385 TaxID=2769488 RepID=UPI00188EFAF5|nr:GNAT family N-acetyltransferase [Nocardia sp. XZ_19_385]
MIWPVRLPPADLVDGALSLREYGSADAEGLFEALRDERVWEHIPRAVPLDAAALDSMMQAASQRLRFTVRHHETIVGTTAISFDPSEPVGVEIGATMFDPAVWGTGINSRVKQLLIPALFAREVAWIQFRTDERNGRSAAAIRKLGVTDLGVRQDDLVRRDGSVRRSRFFRLERSQAVTEAPTGSAR